MKILKPLVSLLITVAMIFLLNRGWNFGSPIPPLGKFLDPFHGFWQNAESAKVPSKELLLSGIKEEITIVYDSMKVPHVFAKNDEDLYFAQGYITAKDRLWQMEFQTHAGAGRISEIIGKAALDFDRSQRRMGMLFAAHNSLTAMEADPKGKSWIDSYTHGINAYIQSLNYADFPIEYKLLDYAPEPWTNLKVAVLQINMAKTLNIGEKDLEMTNALRLFGKETMDILYPDNENPGDPIVDRTGKWGFRPIVLDSVGVADASRLNGLHQSGEEPPISKPSHDVGSNNWAVSGSRTATGSPMLSNDPHLNLTLPSIWYLIHLNAPGINAMGASLPGALTIISGFNDSIAWGITNAQRDVVDWYRIQFKDRTKNEYLSDGKWKKSRKEIEKFIIKGGEAFYDTIVYTHQGPVVYDESFHGDNEKKNFAYRWVTHDPSAEYMTFHLLNRGKNHKDFMAALDHYHSPAQNFVFASAQGDIAMRVQGKYPVRTKNEGKFILDGTKTSNEWKAFIPNDQNVADLNPARGFVSSANQFPADATYPYYIYGESYEAYRNRRINKRLATMDKATPQDLMGLQLDLFNLKASESLPLFLTALDSTRFTTEESNAFRILRSWDYFNTIDSEGASYYQAWWESIYRMTWDEIESSQTLLEYPTAYTTIKLIKENPAFSFFDILSTPEKETAKDVIQKSFTEGVTKISDWKKKHPLATSVSWADYKDTFVGHLLRGLPAFSYHVRHGGGTGIVDASTHTHGPSWRMVVSLEKAGVRAWGVYPGGQSGNPGSPYYNSMLDRWTQGKYFELHPYANIDLLKPGALAITTLKPASK